MKSLHFGIGSLILDLFVGYLMVKNEVFDVVSVVVILMLILLQIMHLSTMIKIDDIENNTKVFMDYEIRNYANNLGIETKGKEIKQLLLDIKKAEGLDG